MTDREILELCHKAFEAITTADASKRLMRSKAIFPSHMPYMGAAPYRLAVAMRRILRDHLGIRED